MGLFDKIKDINEMRKQAKQLELMLANEEVTGMSSKSWVKITVDGNQKIKSVEVDDAVVGNRGDIARSIREALDDLNTKHRKMLQTKFGGMFGA